ncbi:NAD-dependent epimerase [Candidatus Magnetomoraceae bacterium gMMP-15]
MKVVVFGGSGFLGSHVADALSDSGYKVTVFDIKSSPYLRQDQSMVIGDILAMDMVEQIVKEHDIVYHFAGIADITGCAKNPVDTVKYNILGTANILEACRNADIQRFMFASSAYVYSTYGYFYRTSKQACESLIEDYHNLYGLKYTCLRYGSLYGDRADERNSIYKILKQAIAKGKIVFHGVGDEIREFIHVQDAAQSSVKALKQEFENQCLMLTGTQVMRYSELLEMIKEMLHMEVSVEIVPSQNKAHYKITPYNFSPKLGKKLVTNPHIDMGQGLLLCMANIYEEIHGEKMDSMIKEE